MGKEIGKTSGICKWCGERRDDILSPEVQWLCTTKCFRFNPPVKEQVLNIGSRSDDQRAKRLSNFSGDSFILDGIRLTSVEGFIQGIKFPEAHPTREQAFRSVGKEAKRLGKNAERKFVWWQDQVIHYGSHEHHHLIERAIEAKFEQNPEALKALLVTKGMTLTHDLGHPESPRTSLPAKVFCDILTRIREEH